MATRTLIRLTLFLLPIFFTSTSYANGCIVVRPTSLLTVNLDDSHSSKAGKVEFTTAYRYLYSDRHFRGREEEKNRQAEGSDVRNRINTLDYTWTYWYDDTWRFSASVPYVTATRSSLYEHDRVNRHSMEASGVGDVRLMAYRNMLQTTSEGPMRGVTLGLGVKLPTGKEDVKDIAHRPTGPELRNVDQSIQLGDGGTGLIFEVQAFRQFISESTFGFVTASYLFNPEDTNGVETHRSNPLEAEMSVPDTYQVRAGFTQVISYSKGLSFDTALRAEGVPAEDLIGDSNGFRRPGYAIYIEPAINFQKGRHRANLSVPYAIERNRVQSVADRASGAHGDAAFADYLVMGSYGYEW